MSQNPYPLEQHEHTSWFDTDRYSVIAYHGVRTGIGDTSDDELECYYHDGDVVDIIRTTETEDGDELLLGRLTINPTERDIILDGLEFRQDDTSAMAYYPVNSSIEITSDSTDVSIHIHRPSGLATDESLSLSPMEQDAVESFLNTVTATFQPDTRFSVLQCGHKTTQR